MQTPPFVDSLAHSPSPGELVLRQGSVIVVVEVVRKRKLRREVRKLMLCMGESVLVLPWLVERSRI